VHGETPTPSLVEDGERVLRRLSTECNQDTETIVMNIEVSIGFIHDEIGLRESAMDMADAVDAAASAFQDRDCVKAMRTIAAGEVMWLAGPPESDGKMAGPRRDRELGLEITRAEAFTQRAVDRFVAIFGWSRHRR